ncbi:MAG: helix-turn-helix domain-containing protein, partial [Promethearchaeota archaeon]
MESISQQLKVILEEKKIFKSGNLFRCILGLNEIESNVFTYLLKNDNVSTMELTEILDKDRSSIQRALQVLLDLRVIKRYSLSLKEYCELKGIEDNNKRGYLYVYKAKDLNKVKVQFRNLLDKWYSSMVNYIDNLDSLFDCYEENGEIC